MDEIRENLTCIRVADFRESGSSLPEELLAHASSCRDCQAVDEMNQLLHRYTLPEMSAFSRNRLWEKMPNRKAPGVFSYPVRYAIAAVLICFIGLSLYLNRNYSLNEPALERPVAFQPSAPIVPASIVTQVEGEVFIRDGNDWKPVHLQDRLNSSSTLRVSSGGNLHFTFPGETEIILVGKTEGTIKSIASSRHPLNSIYLAYGKAFIHHRGNSFSLETPQASIDAIGTDFSVRYEDQATHVRVFQGRVRLRSLKSSTMIGREEELHFVPHLQARVRRFHLREADAWERREFHVVYFKQGKMIVKPPVSPAPQGPTSLKKQPSIRYYDAHLKRAEIKNEEQIQKYDERVRKREEELLHEQEKHDEDLTR